MDSPALAGVDGLPWSPDACIPDYLMTPHESFDVRLSPWAVRNFYDLNHTLRPLSDVKLATATDACTLSAFVVDSGEYGLLAAVTCRLFILLLYSTIRDLNMA